MTAATSRCAGSGRNRCARLLKPVAERRARAVGVELLAVALLRARAFERGHEAEIDVHGLIGGRVRVAGNVVEEGANGGLARGWGQLLAARLGGGEAGGDEADGG